jgi:hypothetical protein
MVKRSGYHAIHPKVKPVHISPLLFIGKIKIHSAILQQLVTESGLIVLVGIGPNMEPDITKGIRGMIGVLDPDKSIQAIVCIMEGNVDGIMQFLLPVGSLGMGGKPDGQNKAQDKYFHQELVWGERCRGPAAPGKNPEWKTPVSGME